MGLCTAIAERATLMSSKVDPLEEIAIAGWLTDLPIAHRGLHDVSAGIPENSMASFRRAISLGVAFEFDVQQLADGTLVVQHDAQLKLHGGAEMPLAEAGREDLGRAEPLANGETLPLFEQVLDANADVPMIIDVRRWSFDAHGRFEKSLMRSLKHYGGPYAVQSFDPTAVLRFARCGYRPVGQAAGGLSSVNPLFGMVGRTMITNTVTRPDYACYQLDRLPTPWMTWWRSRGVPLLAYTAHSEGAAALASGVADNYFFADFLPDVYRRR